MATKQADWGRHYLSEHPLVLSHSTQTLLSLPRLYWNSTTILKGFQQQKMNRSENTNSALARQARGSLDIVISSWLSAVLLECPACTLPQNSGHSSLLHHHEGYTGALVVLQYWFHLTTASGPLCWCAVEGSTFLFFWGAFWPQPRVQGEPWSIRPLWLYALQNPRHRFVLTGPADNFMLPHFQHSEFPLKLQPGSCFCSPLSPLTFFCSLESGLRAKNSKWYQLAS